MNNSACCKIARILTEIHNLSFLDLDLLISTPLSLTACSGSPIHIDDVPEKSSLTEEDALKYLPVLGLSF